MKSASSEAAKSTEAAITMIVTFHGECEHDGDLEFYVDDLRSSGAKILNAECHGDYPSHSGTVEIQVDDFATFMVKFRETDGFESSSLCRHD